MYWYRVSRETAEHVADDWADYYARVCRFGFTPDSNPYGNQWPGFAQGWG